MSFGQFKPIVRVFVLGALLSSCAMACQKSAPPAQASAESVAPAGTESAFKALSPSLEEYAYPHEVKRFAFESQRQKLEMAYMDIAPKQGVNPSGQTVVLLHGKNFSGAYWGTTIDALTAKGHRVVVPDQVGFGKSSKPERYQYSFQTMAMNTAALLESLGVEKCSLVGHSMGGMLATRHALMFPEQVEKLTLVNPIGLEDWKRTIPYQSVESWYESELQKTPDKIKSYMKSSYFDGKWDPAYDDLLAIQAGWTKHPDYAKVAWSSALTYDMILTQPVLYEFEDLKMPVQLIIGVRDRTALGKNLVSKEVASQMGRYDELGKQTCASIGENCQIVELDGIGHIPQYEAFEPYITALLGFVGS